MERIEIGEIVGESSDGRIYLVDHVFRDGGRMGVVGRSYRPVLRGEYEAATGPEGLRASMLRWWNEARRRGDVRTLVEYASDVYGEKGDAALWELADPAASRRLREHSGLSEDEAPIFICCTSGLCIHANIDWYKVIDGLMLFHLLDVGRGREDAWTYFVNRTQMVVDG